MSKFIFVVGGTGSGKSTVAKEIVDLLSEQGISSSILALDDYYLPKSMLDPAKKKNFDVPEALDEDLIRLHLKTLEKGQSVDKPTYDMRASDRIINGETPFLPQDVIIVEGIFAGQYISDLQRTTDKLKIYMQSPTVSENYSRKENRDAVERGKSDAHIRAMKKNQMGCLFRYVTPHMLSAEIVIENTWQPDPEGIRPKIPMIIQDKLTTLLDFVGNAPVEHPDLSNNMM